MLLLPLCVPNPAVADTLLWCADCQNGKHGDDPIGLDLCCHSHSTSCWAPAASGAMFSLTCVNIDGTAIYHAPMSIEIVIVLYKLLYVRCVLSIGTFNFLRIVPLLLMFICSNHIGWAHNINCSPILCCAVPYCTVLYCSELVYFPAALYPQEDSWDFVFLVSRQLRT